MSFFSLVLPLFIIVSIPRVVTSILVIIKWKAEKKKKDYWLLIKYKERSFTLLTQIFYYFFYLVTAGMYYKQIKDQGYADSTVNMAGSSVGFITIVIIADIILELYFYIGIMEYSVVLIEEEDKIIKAKRDKIKKAKEEAKKKKEKEQTALNAQQALVSSNPPQIVYFRNQEGQQNLQFDYNQFCKNALNEEDEEEEKERQEVNQVLIHQAQNQLRNMDVSEIDEERRTTPVYK